MRRGWIVSVGGLLLLALAAPGAAAAEVLHEEDVVRAFVSGRSTAELLRWIGASDVQFDLSDEMVEELRLAGLPRELIEAMRQRQVALHGAPEAPAVTGTPPPETAPRLVLLLEPGRPDAPRPRIEIPDEIPQGLAEELRLPPEQRRFTDVALFLVCRTADHVPDHWRSQSPLGRDFISMPRHRTLAFLPGAEWHAAGGVGKLAATLTRVPGQRDGDAPPPGVLRYTLPATIEVELEPGVAHDLTLGLALQAGDRYFQMTHDERDGLVLEHGELRLEVKLEQGGSAVPQLRFVKTGGAD